MGQTAHQSDSHCLLLFLKLPQLGKVKSRLAATIGPTHATHIYENFIFDLTMRLQGLPYPTLIFYTPRGIDHPQLSWLEQRFRCFPQVGEDLGERLIRAFQQGFELGFHQEIAIGSDCPDLPTAYLDEAFEQLGTQDCVIGPAQDGGYYAIGFNRQRFLPEAFCGVAWSTETVLAKTIQTLEQHEYTIHQLPLWSDIDTIVELWAFYQRHLTETNSPQTLHYLRRYTRVLFQHWLDSEKVD